MPADARGMLWASGCGVAACLRCHAAMEQGQGVRGQHPLRVGRAPGDRCGVCPPSLPKPLLALGCSQLQSEPHAPSPRLQAARDAAQMHPAVQTAPQGIFFPLPKDCSTGARMCKHCKVSSDSSRHSGALSARKLLCCRYIK